MDSKYKIFLTGADEYQWALQEDYNQTVAAVNDFADLVACPAAQIIHTVYWEALKSIPDHILSTHPVICNLSGEWSRYEQDAGKAFLDIARKVDVWIVRSRQAEETLREKGYQVFFIPYTVNTTIFRPLPEEDKQRTRKRLKLPEKAYVIGNFMRDSTAGRMCAPKLVKGPDIFADIVSKLHEKGLPVHVLLAGPRRHWIRKRLKELGVPHTFAGIRLWFDDMRINTLNRKKLNELYNVLDLSLVSSRSEAGPHAILEAAAAQCSQLSSRVGISEDVLEKGQIYDSIDEAAEKIESDIMTKRISSYTQTNYSNVLSRNTPESCAKSYLEVYKIAAEIKGKRSC